MSMLNPNSIQSTSEIDCDVVKAELQDYLDGELELTEKQAIASHLKSCETCAHEAHLLYTTRLLLKHLPDLEPEKEYWDFATRKVLKKLPAKSIKPKIVVVP